MWFSYFIKKIGREKKKSRKIKSYGRNWQTSHELYKKTYVTDDREENNKHHKWIRYLDRWIRYLDKWTSYLDKSAGYLDKKINITWVAWGNTCDRWEKKVSKNEKMTWVFLDKWTR
jgi:hypothetical protein